MLAAKLIAAVIFFGHPFDNAHAKPMQFFVCLGGGNGIARNHHRPGDSVAHSNVQIAAVLHQPAQNFAVPGIFYVLHRLQGVVQPLVSSDASRPALCFPAAAAPKHSFQTEHRPAAPALLLRLKWCPTAAPRFAQRRSAPACRSAAGHRPAHHWCGRFSAVRPLFQNACGCRGAAPAAAGCLFSNMA